MPSADRCGRRAWCICRPAACGARAVGRWRRLEHQLQYSRGAGRLLAGRGDRRVPAFGRRRAGDRTVSHRALLIGLDPPERLNHAWTGVAAVWILAVGALVAWLVATPSESVRAELVYLQFWSLETCVFLGLALAAAVFHEVWSTLESRDAIAIAVLSVLAVGLTVGMARRTNRIYYDELIYQNIGQNLAAS